MRTAGAESGRRGMTQQPHAGLGRACVRPCGGCSEMQQVTMFSQSFRPPWATGTTWSKVSSMGGKTCRQYWQVWVSRA